MSEPVLLIEKKDRIATVTMNRPEALNALSKELRAAMIDAFSELKRDSAIEIVILTGAGRAFCAGMDLKELSGDSATAATAVEIDLAAPLREFGRPIIGAINGFAITGGFELALACDIIVASSDAQFADTHARVGILPGSGLSQKLSRLVGIYRAKEISLTGNFINARQAESWGLVNRVVDPKDLLPVCRSLAKDILSSPQEMVRSYKKLIDDGFGLNFKEAFEFERKANRAHALSVRPESVAQRRKEVLERGRKQKT